MSQLSFLLTHKYAPKTQSNKWWECLTEAQRQFHKRQYYGFSREKGQLVILPEQKIITKSYEMIMK